jgi:hypothetical protein
MDAVDREILIDLLAEALMRDSTFRPARRNWPSTRIDARGPDMRGRSRRASLSLRHSFLPTSARAAA